jgi:hypothetical protein
MLGDGSLCRIKRVVSSALDRCSCAARGIMMKVMEKRYLRTGKSVARPGFERFT